ncbi:MAG: hypothetical protein ABEI77_02260 [Halorientalis sp.]
MRKRIAIGVLVLVAFVWSQGVVTPHLTVFPQRDFDHDGLNNAREHHLGTNAFASDTDGDGIDDWLEVAKYGTSPTKADTDGDGYPDGVELASAPPIAGADPLQKDVYVEIDYMRGAKPSGAALQQVTEAFADAPIRNPDGSTGIDLHLLIDDEIPRSARTTPQNLTRIRRHYFDNASAGYHYAVFVSEVSNPGFVRTGFEASSDTAREMAIEYHPGRYPGTFMHELGHSLGIDSADYEGVDSHAVSASTYPSVMNYNYDDAHLHFSHGGQFDDWAHINDSTINPPPHGLRQCITSQAVGDDR